MGRFNWDAFAGGVAKGIQTEQDMRAKQQRMDWEQEDREYTRQQRTDEKALKEALKAIPQEGMVMGGRVVSPQNFASEAELDAALALANHGR